MSGVFHLGQDLDISCILIFTRKRLTFTFPFVHHQSLFLFGEGTEITRWCVLPHLLPTESSPPLGPVMSGGEGKEIHVVVNNS
jgi:hypothetical protein